jgi:hypothetical protein
VVPDATPDYCPFCGAQLGDDPDAVDDHLAGYDDCARRFEARRGTSRPEGGHAPSGGYAASWMPLLAWLLVILVRAYSLRIRRTLHPE